MYYYIMVDPNKLGFCKVGITKNVTQRLKAYRTAAPQAIMFKVYDNVSRLDEKRLLDILSDIFQVDRELVKCQPEILVNIVDGYFDDKLN